LHFWGFPFTVTPVRPVEYDDKTRSQAILLENRLRKRYKHLLKWARRTGTGAFRLYDRDIPEIPLVLDLYQGEGGSMAVAGSLYRRPYEKDPAQEEIWLKRMVEAMTGVLALPPSAIFMRERRHQKPGEGMQYERRPRAPDRGSKLTVNEGGLKFRVNLSDYLDTGLFLDRRRLRAKIRDMAGGRRVLNLFAYTCSFSLYAMAGGALSADSVDLSNTYLDWGKENFGLNGLTNSMAHFIRADTRSFLEEAKKRGQTWDLIILDPPAFSNSKKMEGSLDIQRDHEKLLALCLAVLAPGGTLIFSVNMKGFKLAQATDRPGIHMSNITEKLRDEDFPDRRIPACFVFQKTDSST
jgi:23S rRNA G2069 N7-methylase RlmK/C1962 C5-methylase RlmI